MTNPIVFISYAHESPSFRAAVKALADWLVDRGIEVITDHPYENRPPPDGWQAWMLHNALKADAVLVVCSPKLKARYEKHEDIGVGNGAIYEGVIVTQWMYDASQRNSKFFPVIPDGGDRKDIPLLLRPFDNGHRFPSGNNRILRLITEEVQVPKPGYPFESLSPSILPDAPTVPAVDDSLRRSYLGWLTEHHQWLLLLGIREANTVRRVELERVYVALKADPDSSYDRRYARQVHDLDVTDLAKSEDLGEITLAVRSSLDAWNLRRTFRPAREHERRAQIKAVQTLADAFARHRWLVVLGAPGSGKSTLARWLTLRLARAALEPGAGANRVRVPAGMVDPDASNPHEVVDLGPARLPVLVRVADYAREFAAVWKADHRALPLVDFIGHHLVGPEAPRIGGREIECGEMNALIRAHLCAGEAVVILDGLDELGEDNRRQLVDQIEHFIRVWINGRSSEPGIASEKMGPGTPAEIGGNQILITSRFVGYHIAPIEEGAAHFDIQPMTRTAVERFCVAWSEAVDADAESAEGLVAAIFDSDQPALEELATNPLLVTILATVYRFNGGRLPDQRAELYDRAIDNLLRMWLDRDECRAAGLQADELLAALEPVAAHMHESSAANGLIHIDEIGELITGPLADWRRINAADPLFARQHRTFLSTLRDQVGLLAEQSDGNYAFLHRTFQEFLAGRHLLRVRSRAAGEIVTRFDSPLWREPILLALGFATYHSSWGAQARTELLRTILDTADPIGHVIPRAALMLCFALVEMRRVPEDIVKDIAGYLLATYAQRKPDPTYAPLIGQIAKGIASTRGTPNGETVCSVLGEALRRKRTSPFALDLAAADLLGELDWFTTETVEALLKAVPHDRRDWGWPVDRALRSALCQRPSEAVWLSPAPALNLDRVLNQLPVRRALERDPSLVEFVRSDLDWLCLVTSLCGGYGDCRLMPLVERLQANYVNTTRSERVDHPVVEAHAAAVKILLSSAQTRDAVVELTFRAQDLYREPSDLQLARYILGALRGRQPASALVPFLREQCLDAPDEAARAEAAFALLVLDASVPDAAFEELRVPIRELLWRMGASIQEAIVRTGRSALRAIPFDIPESHKASLYANLLELNALSGGFPIDVTSRIAEKNDVACFAEGFTVYQEAEYWAALLSGSTVEDVVYNVCVVLDVAGKSLFFTEPFARLGESRNMLMRHRLAWDIQPLQPRGTLPQDIFQRFLDAVATLPEPFKMVGEFAVEVATDSSRRDYHEEVVRYRPECVALAMARRWGQDEQGFALRWLSAEARELLWAADLLAEALQTIDAPYLRFRALWRLEPILGLTPGGQYQHALVSTAQAITDPHERIQASECLLRHAGSGDVEGVLVEMAKLSERIADADTRARALGRLALIAPQQDLRRRLLKTALSTALQIEDHLARSQFLREVRPHLLADPLLLPEFEACASSLDDSWLRAIALADHLRMLHLHREKLAAVAAIWAPLRLGFLALSAATAAFFTPGSGFRCWASEVESKDVDETSCAPIRLPLASHLDEVLHEGDAQPLRLALTRARGAERSTWQFATAWRDSGPADVRHLAALVLAEGGNLTEENLRHLPQLLHAADDRIRYRAMLALNGPRVFSGNVARRFSPRRSGVEIIDFVAEEVCRHKHATPEIKTSMEWISHDIFHDSVPALDRWLEMATVDGVRGDPARWLVSSIESAAPHVVARLIQYIEGAPTIVGMAVLKALCRLRSLRSLKPDVEQLAIIRHSIRQIPADSRKALSLFDNDVEGLLALVATAADEGLEGDEPLPLLDERFERELIWLDDATVDTDPSLLDRLAALGRQLYASENQIAGFSTVAELASHNASAIRLLFHWTYHHLRRDAGSQMCTQLLRATAAVAEAASDLFAAETEPADWEPLLVEIVETGASWQSRQCALILLGRLRRVSAALVPALQAAMRDVFMLPLEAERTVARIRFFESDLLEPLLPGLQDASAVFARATVRLLAAIALAEGTPANDRRRILSALAAAAVDPTSRRPVFTLVGNEKRIECEEWLNQSIVRAIFDISRQ